MPLQLINEDVSVLLGDADLYTIWNRFFLAIEVKIRVTEDEVSALEKRASIPPLKAPVIFDSPDSLLKAIASDVYPVGQDGQKVTFEQIKSFMMAYPPNFMMRKPLNREKANEIIAAVYNKVVEVETIRLQDETAAIAEAKKVLRKIYDAWPHGRRFYGEDWRSRQRAPTSSAQMDKIAPIIIKELLGKTVASTREQIKKIFSIDDGEGAAFPKSWLANADIQYREETEEGALTYRRGQGQAYPLHARPGALVAGELGVARSDDQKPDKISKKTAGLKTKIYELLGKSIAADTTLEVTPNYLLAHGKVTIDLGGYKNGFTGNLRDLFRKAFHTGKIRKQDDVFIWDTSIPGFNNWISTLARMTDHGGGERCMWKYLSQVLRSENIYLKDDSFDIKDSEIGFDLANMAGHYYVDDSGLARLTKKAAKPPTAVEPQPPSETAPTEEPAPDEAPKEPE